MFLYVLSQALSLISKKRDWRISNTSPLSGPSFLSFASPESYIMRGKKLGVGCDIF